MRTPYVSIQSGVRVPPGVGENLLEVRKIKKYVYKTSSIISLTSKNHIINNL